jgi:hypothetical protein
MKKKSLLKKLQQFRWRRAYQEMITLGEHFSPGSADGIFFIQIIPILGIFRRALDWKRLLFSAHLKYVTAIWYILWSFGIFYGHLVILWSFGINSAVLVSCAKKNLATLLFT